MSTRPQILPELEELLPRERELPFDSDYVTYVWFDALLNYLTGIGWHPDPDKASPASRRFWPADVQLLGKDILTTHAVYWSTMLMAMEVPLADVLAVHGWWTSSDGDKISKRSGKAIDIGLLVDEFGADATRYFFVREKGLGGDGSFSYEGFLNRYNADLANDLGNLASRSLSMIERFYGERRVTAPMIREAARAYAVTVRLARMVCVGRLRALLVRAPSCPSRVSPVFC